MICVSSFLAERNSASSARVVHHASPSIAQIGVVSSPYSSRLLCSAILTQFLISGCFVLFAQPSSIMLRNRFEFFRRFFVLFSRLFTPILLFFLTVFGPIWLLFVNHKVFQIILMTIIQFVNFIAFLLFELLFQKAEHPTNKIGQGEDIARNDPYRDRRYPEALEPFVDRLTPQSMLDGDKQANDIESAQAEAPDQYR